MTQKPDIFACGELKMKKPTDLVITYIIIAVICEKIAAGGW